MAETSTSEDGSLTAAYAFVQSMLGKADGALDRGTSPFWHGWALCEAFLAGTRWQSDTTGDRRGKMLPRSARVVPEGRTSEQIMHGRRTPRERDGE